MLKKTTELFAVLQLRDIVMFPGMVAPLFVRRSKSISALEEVVAGKVKLVLVTQRDPSKDNPTQEDLYEVGVVGNILQLLKLPDNTVKVLIEADHRVKIKNLIIEENLYKAKVEEILEEKGDLVQSAAFTRSLLSQFETYVELNKKINPEIISSISEIKNPSRLVDNIASHLAIEISKKQEILELTNIQKRAEFVFGKIESEISILNAEKTIRMRVKQQMEKTQKDYYLNEQMKAIQKELNDGDEHKNEFDEISAKIKKTKLSKEALDKVNSELKKLRSMSPMGAEASIVRNYIDTVLSLPWGKNSSSKSNLKTAMKILDDDHYGLEKVKERIIEYLAVNQRTNNLKGPIICLVGPPGVGKTSLAKSIAEATGRQFVKFALGGMRDEAEIRGHRRTYVGAMPGKILQLLKKAKTSNPVMLLDEIDKLGADFRGDPSFALLEVLDPEQNNKFLDHYLEVEYDLSNVMFIATANSTDIPRPLLDRMELIRLSGYTEDEKVQIASRHLVDKQKTAHGLKNKELSIDTSATKDIVRYYTREAGVRNLEKEIAKISRKSLKRILESEEKSIKVTNKNLSDYLGVRRYDYGKAEKENYVGVTTGLAYTEVGGELLSLEAVNLPGKGEIKMTGKLGNVMQESAQAAFSFFKSKSTKFGVTPPKYQKRDIHLHVPEGAIPKDGPSAGVAMFTSIVSVMTGIPVKKSVAMTGEITLRGRVLPIGGLKEKLLAALRGGIKTVLIPKENKKDLSEIPDNIKDKLEIITISEAEQALEYALTKKLKPVTWTEEDEVRAESKENTVQDVVTH